MPEYTFGGQNLLKLTDTEKLEELRNFTLFDLVNPILSGDSDNLLALQNKIQENRRFYNTYTIKNPPERKQQEPQYMNFQQTFKDVRPTPYPMRLDTAHAQNYYNMWNNEYYQYQNKQLDALAMGALEDPDTAQIVNSKRQGYTATDKRIMKGNAKPSLLEECDSGAISSLDIALLQ